MPEDDKPDTPKDEEYTIHEEKKKPVIPVFMVKPCCAGMVESVLRYGSHLGIVDHMISSPDGFAAFLEHVFTRGRALHMAGCMMTLVSEETGVPFHDVNVKATDKAAELLNLMRTDRSFTAAEEICVVFTMLSLLQDDWRKYNEAGRDAEKGAGVEGGPEVGPGQGDSGAETRD